MSTDVGRIGGTTAAALRGAPRRCPGQLAARIVATRLAAPLEVLYVLAFYVGYEVVRALTPTRAATALDNSADLWRIERWAHLAGELDLNRLVVAHDTLSTAAGYYYGTLHFLVTPLVLGWLWWRRPTHYAPLRSGLALASALALVVFWLYPVAPPRLALPGTVDTLVSDQILGANNPHGVSSLINEYAAMPSLHVGWAFWCALVLVLSCRSAWRHLAWLYPATTCLVVVMTANHYLVDGFAGVLLVGGCVGLCLLVGRAKAGPLPQPVEPEPARC